jgi:hypothetical protein
MALGLGLGVQSYMLSNSIPTLSPQALAWKARIIANGGSIDDNILTIIDDNLIKPMVSSGIFDCLDRLNLYAGTGNRIAAKTNIINDNYFVIENNVANLGWIDQFGFYSLVTGATGGYLTMGYNPSTAPKWSADRFNCSQFIYTRYYSNTNAANLMGNGFATASRSAAMQRSLSSGISRLVVFMNQSNSSAVSNPLTVGANQRYWLCGTRSGNIVNNIVDSESISYTLAPLSSILNQEIAELSLLGQSGGPNLMDLNSHQASGHGNNNFNNQLLRSYITNTLTALNS